MPLEEVNGIKLHTQTLGDSGPTLVMLHGMIIGSLSTWFFSIAPNLSASATAIMYDLRGHGLSERPETDYGVRSMTRDLGCLIARRGLERVTLVGHSFGSVIAMRYAIEHPERVERLVLVEATLPLSSPVWLDSVATRSASRETILELFPERQREIISAGGRRADRLLAQIVALGRNTTMISDLKADPDLSDEELMTIRCPVLLCNGEQAADFTGETRERLLRLLPNVQSLLFDAGHNLPLEKPLPLAESIREFVHA